jgi:hypothetical protein
MAYLIGLVIGSTIRVAIVLIPLLVRFAIATLVAAVKLTIRCSGLVLLAVLTAVTEHWVPESPPVRLVVVGLVALTAGAALADAENNRAPKARRAGIVRTPDGRVYRFKQSDVSKADQRRWAKARYEQSRPHPRIAVRAAHEARMRAQRAQARIDRAVALKEPRRSTFFSSPDFDKETNP